MWVNKNEIAAIAAVTGDNDIAEFEKKYVRRVGIRKSLVEFANGDCVFFDPEKRNCTVYDARPRQCRTWPFWDSNVRSKRAWKETCAVCPGSGTGTLHQLVEIEASRKVVKV